MTAASRQALRAWGDDSAPSYAISPLVESGLMIAAVGAALGGYLLGPRHITCTYDPDTSAINRFDRGALRFCRPELEPVGLVLGAAAFLTPIALSLIDRGPGWAFVSDLVIYGEILALNTAINIGVKTLVQRPIPALYGSASAELAGKPSSYRSFYSGHTAHLCAALLAAAVASQTRGRRRVWLWGLAAVGPLGMAATRVGAGRHFYSDVLTGALVGGLLGGLVPLVHPRRPEGARVARPALCGG